ncbi:MAG: relaxase/mobilization nuclease domain-containing protein [Hyphomonadaceae bacterium]|nr:relaxase/mobilization nuclease domain-containing protein [Hyphomonadaceae bacterium]
MPDTSFNRLFRTANFARAAAAEPELRAHRAMRIDAPIDGEELRGRVQRGKRATDGGPGIHLSKKLDGRLGVARRFGFRRPGADPNFGFDPRQRAVVKIHYFSHAGGGSAALRAHTRYVAREAAARAPERGELSQAELRAGDAEQAARTHAAYIAREKAAERSIFYDAAGDGVDGAARAAAWAKADRRHFRIILAPEKGAELGDLKPYVRDVMARAEAVLRSRLEWVAVDHWDTDNPHTHIVLRGRRADGRDLAIPREYVQHGFRNAARDAATERLGYRAREDERLALERETRAHRPTRLDALIACQVGEEGKLKLSRLEAPNGDPNLTNALRARARELERLGLASETKRNVLSLSHNWRDQLAGMELHLNIRKRLVQERTAQQDLGRRLNPRGLPRGLLDH